MQLNKAFRAKNGISFSDEVGVAYTANDPRTGGGEPAPIGSILIRKGSSGESEIYQKQGSGDTDWEKRSSRKILQSSDPTATSDSNNGYSIFDEVVNTTSHEWFICTDATPDSAVWKSTGDGGGTGLPNGGTTGQVLSKNSNADGDAVWSDIPAELPSGGTTGQILAKASANDGDVSWIDAPSGGAGGKSFVKEYYRYYSTRVTWDTWSNNNSVMYDRQGDATFNNSGYQQNPSEYRGAIWIPHNVTKISVAGFLRQLYNKSGVTQTAGTPVGVEFHIVRLNSSNRESFSTFQANAIIGQTVNHQQTTQTSQPNIMNAQSVTLSEPLVAGELYGIGMEFVNSGHWEIVDAVMFSLEFEE